MGFGVLAWGFRTYGLYRVQGLHLRASSREAEILANFGLETRSCRSRLFWIAFQSIVGPPYLVLWSFHSTICCRCFGLEIDLLTLSCLEMLPRCQNARLCYEMLPQCKKVRFIAVVMCPFPNGDNAQLPDPDFSTPARGNLFCMRSWRSRSGLIWQSVMLWNFRYLEEQPKLFKTI